MDRHSQQAGQPFTLDLSSAGLNRRFNGPSQANAPS